MQVRCYRCHRPFGLNNDEIQLALEKLKAENLTHYDVPCPHCRRVNRISHKELARSLPRVQSGPVDEE